MNYKKLEKSRLEKIARNIKFAEGFNGTLMMCRLNTIKQYFKGKNCLELGCADGMSTEFLAKYFNKVVAVDGSKKFCKITKKRAKSKNVIVICSFFETLKLREKFDTIIMGHILEHINHPVQLLKKALKEWLKKEGIIIVDVPNANSLHRQAGVIMGQLKKVDSLNEQDKKIGHRRVYTLKKLKTHIKLAKLKIIKTGGVFLKPLTNEQIEKYWSQDMINAFYKLGDIYPQIAAEIYVICKK